MDTFKKALVLIFMAFASLAKGAIIYVDQSATGSNNGGSWANAYLDLCDAMATASTGDEIWVAAGTYLPTRDRNYTALAAGSRQTATFMLPQEVGTYGGFIGNETLRSQRDPSVNICILSGDHAGNDNGVLTYTNPNLSDNSFTVVTANNLKNGEVLDGFHIVKGASIPNGGMLATHASLNGGGLYANGECSMRIKNCLLNDNTAYQNGGAIMLYSGNGTNPQMQFDDCEMFNNKAKDNGSAIVAEAGTLSAIGYNLNNVSIYNNQIATNGSAIANISLKTSSITFNGDRLIIDNNQATGATIYNDCYKNGTISFNLYNSQITNNTSAKVGALAYNDARNQGNCNLNFKNVTIADNTCPSTGVLIYSAAYNNGSCATSFNNCIFDGNASAGFGAYGGATYQMDYSLIDQATCPNSVTCGTNMHYNQTPGFVNQGSGDYTTTATSFGTDIGDNTGLATFNLDLAGNQRIQNVTVDLGAFEAAPCNTILHVNANATGNNNGSNWADAYNDLQDALTYARNNSCVQEIWVAAGLYKPHVSDRTVYYDLVNDVDMYGGFPNTGNPTMSDRDVVVHATVLSGEINSSSTQTDNSYHVFRANYFSNHTIFDGFNIESAYYKITSNPNSSPASYGAASWRGPGRISNCTFSLNFSFYYAGALFARGVEVDKCTFQNNEAAWHGGAIEVADNAIVKNCRFYNNGSAGGGAASVVGDAKFFNCIFKNNFARPQTHWNHYSGIPFQEMFAQGGAIYHNVYAGFFNNPLKIINCTFYGNYGVNAQGGTFATEDAGPGKQLQFYNCIIRNSSVSGNQCEDPFGMGFFNSPCMGSIGTSGTPGGRVDFYDCNIQSTSSGQFHFFLTTNFYGNTQTANPQFNNPGSNDFRLQSSSPCINAGNSANVPATITTDIGGNIRIDGASIDMGAYENFPGSAQRVAYVNPIAVGANNGTTWLDAFTNLQDALNAAHISGSEIEEIWLAEGAYYPTSAKDRTATFSITKNLKIYGGFKRKGDPDFDRRNPGKFKTVLSGNIGKANEQADNSHHVLSILLNDEGFVTLDGISVADGFADELAANANGAGVYSEGNGTISLKNYYSYGCYASGNGGALYNLNSDIEQTNCHFDNNVAGENGGHIYKLNASRTYKQRPTKYNMDYYGSSFTNGSAGSNGGGIFIEADAVAFNNCEFKKNAAGESGGAVYKLNPSRTYKQLPDKFNLVNWEDNSADEFGAALYLERAAAFTENNFSGNQASFAVVIGINNTKENPESPTMNLVFSGGSFTNNEAFESGILELKNASSVLNNVSLSGNTARLGVVVVVKDDNNSEAHSINNSLFTNNTVTNGSQISLENLSTSPSNVDIANCTFLANESYNNHGAVINHSGSIDGPFNISVRNSFFAQNTIGGFVFNPQNPDYKDRPRGKVSYGSFGKLTFYDCALPGEDIHQENPGQYVSRQAYGMMQYLKDDLENVSIAENYIKGIATKETDRLVDAGNKAHLTTNMSFDVFGNKRVIGSSVDIGAIEFGNSSTGLPNSDFAAEKMRLFPNPASTRAQLVIEKQLKSLVVFNTQGQKVYADHNSPSNSVMVETWPNGLYFIHAETIDNETFLGKLRVDN